MVENLSEHIEGSILTLLEGLDLEISLDYKIQNNDEYSLHIGKSINVELKTKASYKGKLIEVGANEIKIETSYKNARTKETATTIKTVKFSSIKSARVFDEESSVLEPEKMKAIIGSKTSAFKSITTIINKWASSPNAPSKEKVKRYMERLVESGDKALKFLYEALSHDIEFESVELHKRQNAILAKPVILEAIYELDSNIKEIKEKLEAGDMTMFEREFKLGFPERFAKGEFFSSKNYFNDWYDEEKDAVKICPFGSSGSLVCLEDLNVILPKTPRSKKDILFSDLPKKEQYWRRPEIPDQITPDNQDQWDAFIKEEFRRRREGIWFMNDGEPVYLTGNHYFALTHCKMLDTGGYMDFRYAQLDIFYHIQACIIDPRCLGQLFVKSRRTGFTYIVLCCFLNDITSFRNKNFGITSKSDSDAGKAFLKFRYMLLNLPFYFIPLIKGKLDSPKEFEFSAPMVNTRENKKAKNFGIDDYLNNYIDYEPTKNDAYDSMALFRYLGDECFSPETKIMMADMSFKEVKDIKVGDFVMNSLGESRRVVKKFEGKAEMYKVIEPYGQDYVVNGNHRLIFEYGKDKKSTKTVSIKAEEYLALPESRRRLFRRKIFKGIEFEEKELLIDPYVLGVWLGDGYSKATQFIVNHRKDSEILEYLKVYFKENKFDFYVNEESENWQKWYVADSIHQEIANQVTGTQHRLKKSLVELNIWGNKRIPKEYLTGSKKQRLELLAGIIDTDGYKRGNNGFYIGMSRKELIEDIYHLSKSLGLDTSSISHSLSNFNTDVYEIRITDYNAVIPCKVDRKKPIVTKEISARGKVAGIDRIGIDKYVGIQIEAENDEERELILISYSLSGNCGKWKKPNDYIQHFGQISPTMNQGGRIVGKAFLGSTVGAMNQGGAQFKELYKASDVKDRNPITQMTASGLYRFFLAAQFNMEEFTDRYGRCHTTKPKDKVLNVAGKVIRVGSIEYLEGQEEMKRKTSDKALNEQYRAYPRTVEYAFRDEASSCVFNITKIYDQIDYNDKLDETQKYITGNFEWVNEKDGDVFFAPNPDGRFKVHWLPSVADGTQGLANRVEKKGDRYFPMNTNCVRGGCDPFSLKSTHGKGSKGAIHGKTVMFPEGGAPSNTWCFEYIARPADETVFFEDVIKVCRYYGMLILIESNRIDLLRHMRNRGYRPFAMDRLDKPKDKLNENEKEYGGQVMSSKDILDSHMNGIGQWIEQYAGVAIGNDFRPDGEMGSMPFTETLVDWSNFDPDNRTEFDATISSGLCIMACSTEKYQGVKKERIKKSCTFVKKFKNNGDIGSKYY